MTMMTTIITLVLHVVVFDDDDVFLRSVAVDDDNEIKHSINDNNLPIIWSV